MMPSILYKYLLGEELVFEDLKRVNLNMVKTIESIETMDAKNLEYTEVYFTVALMDGTEVELVPGGRKILVK